MPTSDYEKDEKQRGVSLTEEGHEHVAGACSSRPACSKAPDLYDLENITLVHHVNQALRAHTLFNRDVDYIVKDGEVIIVDEFTGRMMHGPALVGRPAPGDRGQGEACAIQAENQTLASITFQNYFRLYKKLSGMTGTAVTEAAEFGEIYKLDVVVIPTNRPMIRKDEDDEVYRTARREVRGDRRGDRGLRTSSGQPVLVGTVSIEKSEHALRAAEEAQGVPHQVLNASTTSRRRTSSRRPAGPAR